MIKYLTITEAAKEYGIPKPTIKSWIIQGSLKARRIDSRGMKGRYGFRWMFRTDHFEPLAQTWKQQSIAGRAQQVLTELPYRGDFYLTPKQFATKLQVAYKTVLKWILHGKLKAVNLGSYRHKRIHLRDARKFLHSSIDDRRIEKSHL